jgi:hypothetical protein
VEQTSISSSFAILTAEKRSTKRAPWLPESGESNNSKTKERKKEKCTRVHARTGKLGVEAIPFHVPN